MFSTHMEICRVCNSQLVVNRMQMVGYCLVGMCQSCNFVNVYTKSRKLTNMAASNKKRMVFSYNNSIIVSNGQQKLPVTLPRQPLMKFAVNSSKYCLI